MATQFFYWAVMLFQPAPLYDVLRTVSVAFRQESLRQSGRH